ncbi:hypothetical protein GCM10012275_63900 [Longimycelium tulufanense]|uniref:PPM-type phosphatase domain-containing protein n=1 Tax=Longimycelium tulufanense TaxID=907463 RepID=A0A8J3CJ12_9PSEU|nr:hypothetical protein [Longimycelium tulufanense]GGM84437.1 hypothetical protein GCM10012275_63900 [Longimycelium tulufanense]
MITARVGVATEKGPRRPLNADACAHVVHGDRLALAVVDGTGSTPEVADFARTAAATAAYVAARRTPVHGVLAAHELCADLATDYPSPSGAIVVATSEPGGEWRVAWAGDCMAWKLDPTGQVRRCTDPHTLGERLRSEGTPEDQARKVDHQLTNGLGRIDRYGLDAVEIAAAPVLVLTSDGFDLAADAMATLLRQHPDDPQTAAEALVKTAPRRNRDDVVVLVAHHPEPHTTTTHEEVT